MSKITHDLINMLQLPENIVAKCRKYVGQYGDTFVLPPLCYNGITKRNGVEYGIFFYKAAYGGQKSTCTALYSDDETNAYERFINKLGKTTYSKDIAVHLDSLKLAEHGNVSVTGYAVLGLPQIAGVSIRFHRGKIRGIGSCHQYEKIVTTLPAHLLDGANKEDIIKVFKQHLSRMPADWLAKRYIPAIYLE